MQPLPLLLTLALIAPALIADEDPAAASLAAIDELGALNGQALACRQFAAATQAKTLMIQHAPKTRNFGALFEQATNAAFIEQSKGSVPCPTDADLSAQLSQIGARLQTLLPAPTTESGS